MSEEKLSKEEIEKEWAEQKPILNSDEKKTELIITSESNLTMVKGLLVVVIILLLVNVYMTGIQKFSQPKEVISQTSTPVPAKEESFESRLRNRATGDLPESQMIESMPIQERQKMIVGFMQNGPYHVVKTALADAKDMNDPAFFNQCLLETLMKGNNKDRYGRMKGALDYLYINNDPAYASYKEYILKQVPEMYNAVSKHERDIKNGTIVKN